MSHITQIPEPGDFIIRCYSEESSSPADIRDRNGQRLKLIRKYRHLKAWMAIDGNGIARYCRPDCFYIVSPNSKALSGGGK